MDRKDYSVVGLFLIALSISRPGRAFLFQRQHTYRAAANSDLGDLFVLLSSSVCHQIARTENVFGCCCLFLNVFVLILNLVAKRIFFFFWFQVMKTSLNKELVRKKEFLVVEDLDMTLVIIFPDTCFCSSCRMMGILCRGSRRGVTLFHKLMLKAHLV